MVISVGMKWLRLTHVAAASFLWGGAPHAHTLGADPRVHAQDAPRTWVLIVTGVSGEPRFATEFTKLGAALRDAAVTRFGIADSLAVWLAEDPSRDPARIAGRSTRGGVDTAMARIAAGAGPSDRVFILLIGHGSSQGATSRFNVPGPDLTDADFRNFLARFPTQPIAFVNASSASGNFVTTLSGKNRIILTATKSGAEGNESQFGRFFVAAYTADGADTDKDNRVSLLEAFLYARREVQRDYEQGNRLLTEHAVLDDDGDGLGRADPGPNGPDGLRARSFFLAPAAGLTAAAAMDPRASPLLATRARLQASIDSLRLQKQSMAEPAYEQALESLLVKLAETNKALRDIEARRP